MRTMAKATTAAVSLDTAFTGEPEGWQNVGDQRLAALDFPYGPILSRVRCIAWFNIFGPWRLRR
jgi:hypothetical protein